MEPYEWNESQKFNCLNCKLNQAFGGTLIMGLKFTCDGSGKLKIKRLPIDTVNSEPSANVGRVQCNTSFTKLQRALDVIPIDEFFNRFAE